MENKESKENKGPKFVILSLEKYNDLLNYVANQPFKEVSLLVSDVVNDVNNNNKQLQLSLKDPQSTPEADPEAREMTVIKDENPKEEIFEKGEAEG